MANTVLFILLCCGLVYLLFAPIRPPVYCRECDSRCDEVDINIDNGKRLFRCRQCGKEFWLEW